MKLDQPFDPSQHEPAGDFEPIPEGWYAAKILSTEKKSTKSGAGQYLQLDIEIDQAHHPEVGARRLFDRLNMWNPNANAVDMANRTLSAICYAIGLGKFEDTDELCGKLLAIRVAIKPAQGEYGPSNEIKRYDAIGNQEVGKNQAPKPRQSAPQQSLPPWQR